MWWIPHSSVVVVPPRSGGAPPCAGCGVLSLWVPCPFVASTVPCRQHTDCAMGALHTIAMTIQSPTLQNPYFFSFWLCKLPAGLRLEIPAREPFSPPSPPALSFFFFSSASTKTTLLINPLSASPAPHLSLGASLHHRVLTSAAYRADGSPSLGLR